MNARIKDMTGQRFASLVAVRIVGRASSGDLKWEFLCDCGATFEANGYYARAGKITTCPTCATERTRAANLKHGMTESREFEIWTGMHTRCYNGNAKSFQSYGGRGIAICDRWRESFENFYADMGPCPSVKHSVERLDNNGNYEPDNCVWATATQQAGNKRNNVRVTIDGETRILSDWARHFGVQLPTASLRHKQGLRGMALFTTTKQQLTHNGVTDTVAGWSHRTGLKPSTISMRINQYQWPVDRALTQGASF